MQQAAFESTYPVLGAIKWAQAVPRACSPRRCGCVDVAGRPPAVRRASGSRSARGLPARAWRCSARSHSRWAVLCLPAAVLTGLAFAAGVFAFAATLETDSGFALLFRFVHHADVPVLRHVLPGVPAARLAGAGRLRRRRSGTASTCAATSRSGTGDCRRRSVHVAYLLLWVVGRLVRSRCATLHRSGWCTMSGLTVAVVDAVAPPPLQRSRDGGARLLVERNTRVYRREWLVLVSGFLEPVFYLFSIGVGVAQLVGDVALPGGQVVTYTAFVAPAMLAASAMNGAIYRRDVQPVLQAEVRQAVRRGAGHSGRPRSTSRVGEITWALMRGALYSVSFLVVMLVDGADLVVVGGARAAGGGAHRLRVRRDRHGLHDVHAVLAGLRATSRWPSLPMFLFSATFYPLSVYPTSLQWVVRLSPLYHAATLMRELTTGTVGPRLAGPRRGARGARCRGHGGHRPPAGEAAADLTWWAAV